MPHDHHSHGSCQAEGHPHDGHSHETPLEDIPRSTLYEIIDHDNVVVYNVVDKTKKVIKPWHERNDEVVYLESDADEEIMIRVPFVDASARITSIILKNGQDDSLPRKMKVFVNQDTLDFGDAKDRPCSQELDVPISNDLGEYALKPTKFSNVRSVTLFIYAPDADEDDDDRKTRVYFLGFTGTFTKLSQQPIIAVYEASASPADHAVRGIHENVAKQQF